ncbi:2-hydroxyacid dehydrogenase [Dyadobacter frigoris]|uniref:2-hydroxyacid dehydrogenase n=1 Tax=Dyadobacter frigoris TaxID=2576211 RepID=A0A4V6BJD4_9BACT|nr:2-hydroxyacid dehydrogenase [Dyadobacter frigoris]TKT88463.1 2-hydroxyacid dehydrogenase [Dyadobacter frigoris]GLU54505.1 lactate dehydrogenase [Dyadobacter frigoris]
MKVAFFSTKSYDKEYFSRFNYDNFHELTYFEVPLNHQTASLTVGFEAVCVFVNDIIDDKTIEIISANGIKVVALRCAGFNNVDFKAAKSTNLKVVRVPAYSPESVAEHATALILTLNRKTHKAYNRVREGNFSIENLTGFNLSGKTVGVIGTGLIGASFCKIMLGFGCKVLAYDIQKSADLITKGVQYKNLDDVLIESDVISLHCPLNPETAHIVNAGSISKMKNGVMLINTSRGALINAQDAIEGLKTGKIGYLGIDVYEQEADLFFQDLSESVIQDDVIARLISFPNVLITGHLGFFTKEALEEIATITLNNLSGFESGRELVNEIKS